MKKILFYISGIYNGGTEIALYNLVSQLDKEKYKVYLIHTDTENAFIPLLNKIEQYVEVISITDKCEVDSFIYCNLASEEEKKKIKENIMYSKCYFWFHYFGDGQEEFVADLVEKNEVDKVITVCNTTKNILLRMPCFEEKQDKVITIHNVLPVNWIKAKAKEKVEMDLCSGINLVTVARFSVTKGYERVKVLIDALKTKEVEFKLFIIGSGKTEEDEKRVRQMFQDYKEVEFLGYQENPYKFVKQCDYNVLLSNRETWSLVISEARLLKVPNIVTDFEAVYEQVEDMKTGIILSKDNMDTYIERIDDIVNNVEKFKENMKEIQYNLEDIKKQWDDIIGV